MISQLHWSDIKVPWKWSHFLILKRYHCDITMQHHKWYHLISLWDRYHHYTTFQLKWSHLWYHFVVTFWIRIISLCAIILISQHRLDKQVRLIKQWLRLHIQNLARNIKYEQETALEPWYKNTFVCHSIWCIKWHHSDITLKAISLWSYIWFLGNNTCYSTSRPLWR